MATREQVAELGKMTVAGVAYVTVRHWPLSVEQRGIGRIYWALLPWAGMWAYRKEAARARAACIGEQEMTGGEGR